jgi:hypothetical protein
MSDGGYKELVSTRYKCTCGATFAAHNPESLKQAATSYMGVFPYYINAGGRYATDRSLHGDITARVTESPDRIALQQKKKAQQKYVLAESEYYTLCKRGLIFGTKRDNREFLGEDPNQPVLETRRGTKRSVQEVIEDQQDFRRQVEKNTANLRASEIMREHIDHLVSLHKKQQQKLNIDHLLKQLKKAKKSDNQLLKGFGKGKLTALKECGYTDLYTFLWNGVKTDPRVMNNI